MADVDRSALEKLVRQVLLEKLGGTPAAERPAAHGVRCVAVPRLEVREQDRLAQARQSGFEALLLDTRTRLEALYAASGLTEADRRERKVAILADMNARYAALKTNWGEYAGYDAFFARGVNNATLGAVAAYATMVPDFQALLARVDGHLPTFIEEARACSRRPQAERAACLRGS